MSLKQLAYANVKRNEIDTSKSLGPRIIQTRSRTGRDASGDQPSIASIAKEITGDLEVQPLQMPVPLAGGHIWEFPGHLKNKAFFDLIEHYDMGQDRNGDPTFEETSDRLIPTRKKKRRREGRADSHGEAQVKKPRLDHLD